MRTWTQRPQQGTAPASPGERTFAATDRAQRERSVTTLPTGANLAGITALPRASGGPPPLIQPFSDLAPSDDRFEKEAHAVADSIGSPESTGATSRTSIRRASAGSAGLRGVHPSISSTIESARGSGASVPGEHRSAVEKRLGVDLGGVRIHDDARSDTLNRELNARAFTTGRDIFFRRGEYNMGSSFGRSVLNHELTHVVQQCGQGPGGGLGAPGQPAIQRFVLQIGADDKLNDVAEILNKQYRQEQLVRFRQLKPLAALPKGSKLNSQQQQDRILDHDKELMKDAVDEQSHQIPAVFNKKNPNLFEPKKGKKNDEVAGPLANLPADEPLRIVAHGNIYGRVGGYSGKQLAQVLVNLGLPENHGAGINIHACLPASVWREQITQKDKNGRKQEVTVKHEPHIVELQDSLDEFGIKETVQGFEHCLIPKDPGFSEVASRGYHLYTDVVQAIAQKRPKTLSKAQLAIMEEVMGTEEKEAFLKQQRVVKGAIHWSSFSVALENWMEQHKLAFQHSRLRRANSVRMNQPLSLLGSDDS